MYKLVASDMDETFLTHDHSIPRANVEAIRRMRELGVLFVPASGRPYSSILESFSSAPADLLDGSYVISYNGGTINRVGESHPLEAHSLPFDVARDLFERLGVDIEPTALVADLKQSQKQLLEISRALFFNAKLLILEHLFQIVRSLRDQGTSFIFISHKMPEIFALCDTYTVLRNGTFVGQGKICDTTPREVTGMMVGATISERGAYEPR